MINFKHNGEKGEIQLILGPMFSGKSTELLRRVKRHVLANNTCALISYIKNTRYDSMESSDIGTYALTPMSTTNGCTVVTHDYISHKSYGTENLQTFQERMGNEFSILDVIGIDEGQFFPDVVEYAEKWANLGKMVIVSALDGTFQRKSFNTILELIPLAESVLKLTSICHFCKEEAAFTLRIGNEQQIEIIGGKDKYRAVCRSCYFIHRNK